ncbi:phospholipase D-like domain-containing protein [Rhodobacter capsulatus]|uniref:phospholipase D-like domain-containing protein n=1 Tax=Rhodobacter capsulatus TaxID=1061 RepID=UPI00402A56AD
MTTVRVAVPVLQGTKKFVFDKGRPWTIIEHSILASIALESQNFTELQKRANLPRRVLVEAIVRLMRVGWVELVDVGSTMNFQTTPSGAAAATLRELPSPLTRHKQRRSFVIDQISGTVFRRRQLPFHHEYHIQDLEKRDANIIRVSRPERENVGDATSLLHVLFEEDEQFVAFDGGGERLMERWALVIVRDGIVDGLPSHASEELKEAILQAARSYEHRPNGQQPQTVTARFQAKPPRLDAVSCRFTSSDLVIGGAEHQRVFMDSIKKARHRIIIHSTFISEDHFKNVLPSLRIALDRGVMIDILWGQETDVSGSNPSRQAALNIRKAMTGNNIDRIRVHTSSTHSHSKMLISDTGHPNDFICYIGSCNWLSSSFQSFETSASFRNGALISDVFSKLAELCRSPSGHFSRLSEEYMMLAATISKNRSEHSGSSRMALVYGPMHNDLILQARDDVQKEAFVCSHRMSPASGPLVLSAMVAAAAQRDRLIKIYYGRTSGGMSSEEASALIRDDLGTGVNVQPIFDPRLHAKVLAWDDDNLVISSQNWLSADPPPDKPLSEMGIFINSKGIAKYFRERFQMSLRS